MADGALELDDFLSRFQLLRPQPSRNALNQRQSCGAGAYRSSSAAGTAVNPTLTAAT